MIGNGFDIAHGIKSSYWDFKEWLCKKGKQHLVDMMDIFFSNSQEVWSGVEQALGEYDEKQILDYCRPDEEFDMDHSLSSSARVEDSPNDFFQPVLEEFKEEFHEWVDSIEIYGLEKIYTLDQDCRYLTFNYTDTLESEYLIPSDNIVHIHGSRLNNDEYVVGHNNKRDPNDPWGEDGIIFEQQARQNIITWMNGLSKDFDGIINRYKTFFEGLTNVKQVITYGHSMADIDWPYFEEIIKIIGVDIPWAVSCHKAEDVANANAFKAHFQITTLKILQ